MVRYFRCDEPTKQCIHSRTQEVQVERDGCCPTGNPHCLGHRQPVSWRVAMRELHPKGFWGIAGLVSSIGVLLLLSLLAPDGCQKRTAALGIDSDTLEQRLLALESSQPSPPIDQSETLAQAGQRRDETQRLHEAVLQALDVGDGSKAQSLLDQLNATARSVVAGSSTSGGDGVWRSSVRQLAKEYQGLEEKAESAASEQAGACNGAGTAAYSALTDRIRDGLDRAQTLSALPAVQGPGPELAQIQQKLKALIDDATARVAALPSAPSCSPDKAGLVIAASPGLAEDLVRPLLEARWGKPMVADPSGKCWQLETAAPEVAPGVLLLTSAGADPLTILVDGDADLAIADRAPDTATLARFAKLFPGETMDSRAYSEVIALDAVALLRHPDAAAKEVAPAQLAATAWVVGARDAANIQRVSAVALSTKPVPNPLDFVLTHRDTQAIAFYHQCGPNLAAPLLAFKPATDVRALAASPFSIATEDYSLSYRVIASHSPKSRPAARQLVGWVTSDQGQDRVAKSGFVDLRLRRGQQPVDPLVLATLGQALGIKALKSASRYSTNLRFALNASELDIKAEADIARLPRALAQDPAGKVVILGFTDDTGTAEINQPLSVKRADHIAARLRTFGIPAVAAGLGQQLPVDSNTTDDGRARNRRAEVWVVQP